MRKDEALTCELTFPLPIYIYATGYSMFFRPPPRCNNKSSQHNHRHTFPILCRYSSCASPSLSSKSIDNVRQTRKRNRTERAKRARGEQESDRTGVLTCGAMEFIRQSKSKQNGPQKRCVGQRNVKGSTGDGHIDFQPHLRTTGRSRFVESSRWSPIFTTSCPFVHSAQLQSLGQRISTVGGRRGAKEQRANGNEQFSLFGSILVVLFYSSSTPSSLNIIAVTSPPLRGISDGCECVSHMSACRSLQFGRH